MAKMPDDNGFTVIHVKSGSKSTDHVTPKSYERIYAIEKNGCLNPGFWTTDWYGKPLYVDRTSDASLNISIIKNQMTGVHANVHNKALDKLMSQLDVAQNLFESWYERRQAYELLVDSGRKLLEFAVGWRKPAYWKKTREGLKNSFNYARGVAYLPIWD